MPVPDCQTEEAGSQALERALHWESAGPRPWRGVAGSLVLHALVLFPYVSLLQRILVSPPDLPPTTAAIPLFVPVPAGPAPPAQRVTAPGLPSPSDAPAAPAPQVKVDLGAIRLSFVPDFRNELPQVVQDQHGMLALLDLEDRTVAQYLVQPPAWEAHRKIQDVSRSLRILMDPPEKWTVFRDVARRYGIDLRRYQACALFDLGFRHCLKQAILAHASAAPKGSGRVISARLAIAAAQPCGIEVREVSFAAQ